MTSCGHTRQQFVVIENDAGRGGRPKSACWFSCCVLRVQLLDQLVLMINGVNRFCVPVIFVNVFIHAEIRQPPTLSVCCEWSPRIVLDACSFPECRPFLLNVNQ